MNHFNYVDNKLRCEEVSLEALAMQFGTPLFVYSYATLAHHLRVVDESFGSSPHIICYALKANSNIALVSALARGGAGADVVSGGELARALRAGVDPGKIVYSGVGKRTDEIEAALSADILLFNVEVEGELDLLSSVAQRMNKTARIAIRVNPDVDAGSHDYISTGSKVTKFGIAIEDAPALYARAAKMKNLRVVGVDCHIGSQLTTLLPFTQALERVRKLVATLRASGHTISYIDVGGGLGVRYTTETPPSLLDYATAVRTHVGDLGATIIVEPGRVIAANAGVFLTRVLYRKRAGSREFMITDGAMNDFLRPALYGARHDIWAVNRGGRKILADVVGPVCETGDFLARDCEIDDAAPGDLIALLGAGAYGRSMSSNYNSRPRAAEVLVHGKDVHLIQERETIEKMMAGERIPEFLRS